MSTTEQYLRNYFANLQTRRPQVSGTVATVNYDAETGRQGSVAVSAGGSTIIVPLTVTTPPLAESDRVQLEQVGTAANAQYRIVDASGARPNAGMTQYFNDTTVGGNAVGQGDIILGGLGTSDPNFLYDFSAGAWYARTGATVNGSWASDGTIISGNVSGPNVQITSTAVNLRQGSINVINLTTTYGIRMYTIGGDGAVQRVSIAPDGSGWFVASDKFSWDTNGIISISGNFSASTIDIGGSDATSFHVDADGNLWSGAAAYADGVFKVSNAGALVATNSTITGAITASSGSLSGFLTIGSSGGIYQGSGTAGSPTTGLKIWNDSGTGRIAGYNGGTPQWYANTDGKLYAGGGKVGLTASGIELFTSGEDDRYFKVYNSDITTYTSAAGFVNLQKTDPTSNTYGAMNFGLRHDTNNQSAVSCWLNEVDVLIQKAGNWRYVVEANYDYVNLNAPLKLTEVSSAPTCSSGEAFIYMRSGTLYRKVNNDTEVAF